MSLTSHFLAIRVSAAAQTAVVVKSLRIALDELLSHMASGMGEEAGDDGRKILETIVQILADSEVAKK